MNRRMFLQTLTAVGLAGAMRPRAASAFGDEENFDMVLLEYDSPSWNPRPSAVRRLLIELEMTTSIPVVSDPRTVTPNVDGLFSAPLIIWAGDREFDPLSTSERDAIGAYLGAGGIIVVDSSEGRTDGGFRASIERELGAVLSDASLAPIPDDHVLYKSFYLVDGSPGREQVSDSMDGISFDERLAVIYSHNDLMGAWARDNFGNYEYEVHPGGERQREMAYRLGINIAMYALCLDYKEDQVHVPFILERRRWRVD